ncbi:hypothetical protein M2132_001014 [Dysgonomonas sp. PH5-45]|uniref:hypothetical protein n=1 Tax=unclassified Dysgonomonas TaxID=2630389 RepID=UPI0024771793|nr:MULTISPECIES: hypothetical protein [unclassified Dysgonomonas]MDH6354685.1 hypothetical protein [Dysgonomonas sp. PH5-45]MDH6387583.1 hypothetical protein [Dysgonomonas sp. PH5-37]
MNTTELKVSKVNALKAWRDTDKNGKLLLENLYGAKVFQNQDVRDRIKTFEDALAETGRPNVPDFSNVPENMKDYFVAQYKMSVIAEALNEGWTPDWDNANEKKWWPWFIMEKAVFRFFNSRYCCSYADAGSGSRLCFRTEELSTYCAEQFLPIWRDIQLR